jgi:hypothetical protein
VDSARDPAHRSEQPKQGLKAVLKPRGAQRNGIVVQPAVEGTRIDGFDAHHSTGCLPVL